MSWLRTESAMPRHWKIAPLSDAAFRMHFTAMAWCAEFRTDGRVTKAIVETLPRVPNGCHLLEAITELTTPAVGPDGREHDPLWVDRGSYFEIHDYLEYNISSAEYAKKQNAGKAGGLAKAGNHKEKATPKQSSTSLAHASNLPEKNLAPASDVLSKTPSKSLADPDPDPDPEDLKSPLTPPRGNGAKVQDSTRGKPADPFRASFRTQCPDKIAFTERQRGLATRGSIDINLAWAQFRDDSRGYGKFLVDWESAFSAHLAKSIERIERAAQYRATERNAQRDAATAPPTRPKGSVSTDAAPPPPKALPVADAAKSERLRNAIARIG